MIVTITGNGKLPVRETVDSAGYDLFSAENVTILPHTYHAVELGITIALEKGTYGQIYMRSSLASQHGLFVMAGVIDSDYRGTVKVLVYNMSPANYIVKTGAKIAQLIVHKIVQSPSISYTGIPDIAYTNRMRPVCPRYAIENFNNLLAELVEKQKELLLTTDITPSTITTEQHKKINDKADFYLHDGLNYHFPSNTRIGGFGSTDRKK
jgi:dUTP pyrophosphatase